MEIDRAQELGVLLYGGHKVFNKSLANSIPEMLVWKVSVETDIVRNQPYPLHWQFEQGLEVEVLPFIREISLTEYIGPGWNLHGYVLTPLRHDPRGSRFQRTYWVLFIFISP